MTAPDHSPLPPSHTVSAHRTLALIDDLRQLPAEMPWVEFKENNADALLIGKLIDRKSVV